MTPNPRKRHKFLIFYQLAPLQFIGSEGQESEKGKN